MFACFRDWEGRFHCSVNEYAHCSCRLKEHVLQKTSIARFYTITSSYNDASSIFSTASKLFLVKKKGKCAKFRTVELAKNWKFVINLYFNHEIENVATTISWYMYHDWMGIFVLTSEWDRWNESIIFEYDESIQSEKEHFYSLNVNCKELFSFFLSNR